MGFGGSTNKGRHGEFKQSLETRSATDRLEREKRRMEFNQRIERAIRKAILKAAKLQIREFIRSGRLDKGFGVDLEP